MLEKFPSVRILCIGDLMLDCFVEGAVERISPEAPVPVFRWEREKLMLGGAGNVVANLRALNVNAALVCRIGADAQGENAKRLLDASGVENLALVSPAVPTTQKTRFVARGRHVLRMDRERVAALSDDEEAQLLARISAALEKTHLVILSDYAKGLLSESFTQKIIAACRAAGVPVYVDPKGTDWRKYAGATLVKPNCKELEAACGVSLDPSDSTFLEQIVFHARKILQAMKIDNAVVTLSEKGMIYVPGKGGETIYLPTECREVCDVSGAGDTSMAVLAAARAVGGGFREAMILANVAAGIVVGKVGTAVVAPRELTAALDRKGGASPFGQKIHSVSSMREQVREWQAEGLKVGFTNGCFDCLHLGHLSSLAQAKAHCDRLVVAVNGDDSVRRLKGPSRPVQNELTRTNVLAGLETVDAVVVFNEDTALSLVEKLRPDVIAKEGYAPEDWPEAQCVTAYGGEVVFLKRVEGYSTSSLVERMNEKDDWS